MASFFSQPEDLSDAMIAALPLFKGIPLTLLTTFITEDMIRYYQDGEAILNQGDPPDRLIILLHGQARIFANDTFLVTRQPYEVLGELGCINQTTRNATVLAQGSVQALVLTTSLVETLMGNVTFLQNLLRLVAEKLDESTQERAWRFRQEALLFSEFRAHLSPNVAQRLLATGKRYGGPRFLDAIILFADIRNFTQRSAMMAPEQLAQELNPFLNTVVSIIHRYEGMIDKFIGDAVLALWGITPGKEDPIQQAFLCAKELLIVSALLSFGGGPIQLGIGLNAGRVFSGNVGNEEKRQFTVLGHPVNVASRCEGATKELHAPIVMGEEFARRLPPMELQSSFRRDKKRCCHIATNLTRKQVERWTRDKPIAR